MRRALLLPLGVAALLAGGRARAGTITVGPGDDYTKIESATAGDTVLIQPGTYQFRVFLAGTGTAAMPITIRAADPANPPVWDLGGKPVSQWPGSYTGGDNDRGCWQVEGAYYVVEGIVIQHCTNGIDSAGIRTHASTSLRVRDVLLEGSDDGFTGDGDDTVVEFSEIAQNGNPQASQETHNIYIYDGSFTLRYSYVHDSTHGQNFHIRAQTALLEYNWIARAQNYEGDMMPGSVMGVQSLTLRGNVILGSPTPENGGQVIALFNDSGMSGGYTFDLTAEWNTIVVQAPTSPALVNVINEGLDAASVTLSNNILAGTPTIVGVDDPTTHNLTVAGTSNWIPSGAAAGGLSKSVTGASPGFNDAQGLDFTLAAGSACIGAADASVTGAPDEEYFQNETVKERFRVRASAKDVGAFEHDTMGASYGPYDTPPSTGSGGGGGAGSTTSGGGGAGATGGAGGGGTGGSAQASGSGGGTTGSKGGCGCREARSGGGSPAVLAALLGLAAAARRSRRRVRVQATR